MNKKITTFICASLLALGSLIGVYVSNSYQGFVAESENPTASDCGLMFDKNSIIVDEMNSKEHYIQERTLRLELKGAHIDRNTGKFTLYAPKEGQKNYIYTSGEAFDASKGYGSVANGLESIEIKANIHCKVYVSYTTCDPSTDEGWLFAGNEFNISTNQYPPRYFKIEAGTENVEIESITVGCTAKEKMLNLGEEMPNLDLPKTIYAYYNGVTKTITDYTLKIDGDNEQVFFKTYDISISNWRDTILKVVSYDANATTYNLIDVNDPDPLNPLTYTLGFTDESHADILLGKYDSGYSLTVYTM